MNSLCPLHRQLILALILLNSIIYACFALIISLFAWTYFWRFFISFQYLVTTGARYVKLVVIDACGTATLQLHSYISVSLLMQFPCFAVWRVVVC